jgi:uncharacterized phage infection (PIP) family protein YhgE
MTYTFLHIGIHSKDVNQANQTIIVLVSNTNIYAHIFLKVTIFTYIYGELYCFQPIDLKLMEQK